MSYSDQQESTEKTNSVGKKAVNSRKAWIVVVCLFIAGIAMAYNQTKVTPVITLVQTDLAVSASVAGWISGIFNVLGVVLAFPAVGIVRKWGILKSGIISIVVTLIGAVFGFFAPNEYALLASRVVEGFGLGLISIIAPSTIAMWFPTEKRGLPMGIWSSWNMVAIAAGFLFTGNIIGPEGAWRNMWVVGIFLLVIGLVLFAWKVRPPAPENNYADVEDSSIKITEVFKHKSVFILGIGGLAFGTAIMMFANWIPVFWQQQAGLQPGTANTIAGSLYLVEIFTAILGGFLLDKIKNRRRFVSIDGILYAFIFVAIFHVTNLPGILICCLLYCVIEGVFAAAMWTFSTQVTPEPRLAGASSACYAMFLNIGMMIGAPLAGFILDMTAMQGWTAVALCAAGCQLLAGICFGLIKLYNSKGEDTTAKKITAANEA